MKNRLPQLDKVHSLVIKGVCSQPNDSSFFIHHSSFKTNGVGNNQFRKVGFGKVSIDVESDGKVV